MKVVQICIGKFHHFDLARELQARGALTRIHSAYPRWKLRDEGLPEEKIETFPFALMLYMALQRARWRPRWLERELAYVSHWTLAQHVANRLEDCDVLVALSGSGLEAGLEQKQRGKKYVCDRGSSHIGFQDRLLTEEFAFWGLKFPGIDARGITREKAEYAAADLITVPSEFTRQSFISEGVPAAKLAKIPYGVDVRRFGKVAEPAGDEFQVLFVGQVSLRKGVPYLLEAFRQFRHRKKKLVIIGGVQSEIRPFLANLGAEITVLGSRPQAELKDWMSRSHVMVLPSIEDGLALVQAQAMACGCPIIATRHTGAEDLFEDGKEGFIVPIRDVPALVERLERLAADPGLRATMSDACLQRVCGFGGSRQYGALYFETLRQLTGAVQT